MRQLVLLSSLLLTASGALAQHINNVTVTPNPLHACELATYHVTGTAPAGISIDFLQSSISATAITFVIEASGPSSGSAAFSQNLGPTGPYAEGVYDLSVGLQYNGTITSTWTGTLTVLAPQIPNVGDYTVTSVCNTGAAFPLISLLQGNPDPGGQWLSPVLTPIPNGMFVPGTSMEGDYQYYFPLLSPCDPIYQTLTLTYLPNSNAGTNATTTLCTAAGQPPVNLFPLLGGTPDAGGTWSGANTTGIFTPGVSQPGNYIYHVTGIAPCANPMATVTVVGAPASNAGTGGTVFYCYNENLANLSDIVSGEDVTGIWYAPDGSGITFYDQPIDVAFYGAGNYSYVVTTDPCPADTSTVPVTLLGPPCTVGIAAQAPVSDHMLLAPNPAADKVVVEIERTQPAKGQVIEVSDVNGKVVLGRALNSPGKTVRETLDLSSLAPGAYIVKLVGGQGVPTQRLMVQ